MKAESTARDRSQNLPERRRLYGALFSLSPAQLPKMWRERPERAARALPVLHAEKNIFIASAGQSFALEAR